MKPENGMFTDFIDIFTILEMLINVLSNVTLQIKAHKINRSILANIQA